MDREALDRARGRLEEARKSRRSDATSLEETLDRARVGIDDLVQTAAELEARMPGDIEKAIEEGMRKEVLPVGRNIAELRGLSAQTIRRLDRLEGAVQAERKARVEDLGLLVEVISSGWQGLEQRLARIDSAVERLEQVLDSSEPPAAHSEATYGPEEHKELRTPA